MISKHSNLHKQRLRVAINAQLEPNTGFGGVEGVLLNLIATLGRLNDGPEEYVIIGPWEETDWLKRYLGPNQRMVRGPGPSRNRRALESLKRTLGPARPFVRGIWRRLLQEAPLPLEPEVPRSDGFYERLGCDVIHFPYQRFVVCALPAIYNPHDLQHLHYPQFFAPSTIARRDTLYRAACQHAHTVVVGSHWVKEDVVRQYGIHPEKVQLIPWAPPTQAYPAPSEKTLATVKARYQLPPRFALYPAMTWEHKNHLRLLEALAYLRDREGLVLDLVCTGYRLPGHWRRIEEHLHTLKLNAQVQFLGMVPPEHLRALYRLAQFVVVPTLFEAASGPVFEAWQDRVPVACSTVTSLPQQAGDAALLFDPLSVEAVVDAVRRMATDEDLRAELIRKGNQRLQDFSWERTAKAYRAVYRRAADRPLTEEDRCLLTWDWMRTPRPAEKGVW